MTHIKFQFDLLRIITILYDLTSIGNNLRVTFFLNSIYLNYFLNVIIRDVIRCYCTESNCMATAHVSYYLIQKY